MSVRELHSARELKTQRCSPAGVEVNLLEESVVDEVGAVTDYGDGGPDRQRPEGVQ